MMGGGGFLWYLIGVVLIGVPFWKILPRYGMNKYFEILAGALPLVALVLLWVIAFQDELGGGDA